MKHFFQTLLIFCLLAIPITALAGDTVEKENIEYFKDGSYIVSYITDEPSPENIVSFSTKSATKSKVLKYYDSNDVAKWYVKVTGTFTYGNGSSKCTKAVVTADSYSSTWKVTKKVPKKGVIPQLQLQPQTNTYKTLSSKA